MKKGKSQGLDQTVEAHKPKDTNTQQSRLMQEAKEHLIDTFAGFSFWNMIVAFNEAVVSGMDVKTCLKQDC